jgi:hypothetical protein
VKRFNEKIIVAVSCLTLTTSLSTGVTQLKFGTKLCFCQKLLF